jgi:hypothetical protein
LDEARNLPHVAARMPHDIDEIVFVNGDSVDQTARVHAWPRAKCTSAPSLGDRMCALLVGAMRAYRCANPLRRLGALSWGSVSTAQMNPPL